MPGQKTSFATSFPKRIVLEYAAKILIAHRVKRTVEYVVSISSNDSIKTFLIAADLQDPDEYVCKCKETKMVCSNEGRTYPTICSLNEGKQYLLYITGLDFAFILIDKYI